MANGKLESAPPGPFCLPAGGTVGEELSDGQLLERFAHRGDQAAFTFLVRRHGPMVLGVCRRVLRNAHDAEDAFQATFLVLVHKAGSLRQPNLLSSWLHGVAYRTAQHTRTRTARRCLHEREAARMSAAASDREPVWQALLERLDEELEYLPEKYRAPLVLCNLEGKTHAEAARILGWPAGSMSARLAKARELLRRRLQRREKSFPAVLFPLFLARPLEPVSVPGWLLDTTVQAALELVAKKTPAVGLVTSSVQNLTEATLRALPAPSRRWLVLMLLALAMLLVGATGWVYSQTDSWPFSTGSPATMQPPSQDNNANDGGGHGCH
jgi:RNA polymerase sigma-70 factor (ECF subfamily)